MYRQAMEHLKAWKDHDGRKPLIIKGARQVGKTWLMKEFGRGFYQDTVYVNFDGNDRMQALFSGDLNPKRIILGLELYCGHQIDAAHTLLIFDEIQEIPKALTSLKYFNEETPEYQIVCAGSLLGIALHEGTSFPVGKVEFMDLQPMTFIEFLDAMGKEQYAELLRKHDFEMAAAFRQDYADLLKQYYLVGGMPEAVQSFADRRDCGAVREIQKRILAAYEQDFSKHAPADAVPRIRMLWNSIPSQLARENRKFIYGLIKEGARAREYEIALLWLEDCGLVHQVHRVTAPRIPLKAYEDLKAFKLYLLDVGLLSAMAGLEKEVLLDGSKIFQKFKGALTEQYVLQQLKAHEDIQVFYWTAERAAAEVDFLIQQDSEAIPVEVKAETNLRAKSLKAFHERYQPRISIRASMADYHQEEWLLNIPLWAVNVLPECIRAEKSRS